MTEIPALELPQMDEGLALEAILSSLEAVSRQLESLASPFALLTRNAMRLATQAPEATRRDWAVLCWAGWHGRAPEVHNMRDPLLQRVNRRLELIRLVRRVKDQAPDWVPDPVRASQELDQALADMEAFQASVLSRWGTLEDLEDLLAETYPASNAQLAEVRKTLPSFHPQWYAEDSKPF
jgi:hypothetical protein